MTSCETPSKAFSKPKMAACMDLYFSPLFSGEKTDWMDSINGRQFSHETTPVRCCVDDFPQSSISDSLNNPDSMADKPD